MAVRVTTAGDRLVNSARTGPRGVTFEGLQPCGSIEVPRGRTPVHPVKILSKYILKEHVGPLTFALTALTSLLLLNYIAKNFGELVGKGLPWQVIAEFFILSIPFTFAMTLPMAVLVAVLYAFSRLASENEITAMRASGVGMTRLIVPVLIAASFLAVGMIAFNDQVLSRSNHRLATLQRDIFRTRPTFALKEQVINTLQEGRLYLRAGRIERGSSHMKEVVVYDLSDPTRRRTIIADSGEIGFAPNRKDLFMTLYDGVMQEVPTQDLGKLTRLFYKRDRIRVVGVGSQFEESRMQQGKSDREMTICEMTTAVLAAEKRRDLAAHDYRQVEAEVARHRGQDVKDPARSTFKRPVTLGGLYCSLLSRLGLPAVREAWAASLRAQDRGSRVEGRDSAAAPTNGGSRPIPATPARPSPRASRPDPRASDTPGIDAAEIGLFKSRLDAAREQMEMHEKTRDKYLVEIHKKFSLAVACVVFVLVGAPIALRFPRGGVGLALGVSFAVFALYYVGLISGEALADRSIISPFWGMWGHNVIMALLGLLMSARMGREAATTRGGDFGDLLESLRVWVARGGRKVGLPLDRRRRLA
jgi:lipopolysaccharide export system permease protein